MKLLNLAIIGGLGYLGYTMLTKKKAAAPATPASSNASTSNASTVEVPTLTPPTTGMTAAEVDKAIDNWMAQHPGEGIPGWLTEQGIEMGVIF